MCHCDAIGFNAWHVHCDGCDAKVEAEQSGPGSRDIDVIGGVVIDGDILCHACAAVTA